MCNQHFAAFITTLLLQYFVYAVNNLACELHPRPLDIANMDLEHVDLWIEVRRDSTKSIGDGWLALGPNKIDKTFRNFTANYKAYGWYEGYSAGFPTQPPKTYVSYGCWFWPFGMWAHHQHSHIFIRLGNFVRGEHGIIQNKFGLPGGSDKGYCGASLQHGFDSVAIDMEGYFQLIHCTDGCATTPFNTTCPPGMELRQGYRASEECGCDDANNALNCDLSNSISPSSKHGTNSGYSNVVTRQSIANNKCIYELPKMKDIKHTSIRAFDVNLIFTAGLLKNSAKYLDEVSSIGAALGVNNTVLLNWETTSSLEFFGYPSGNASAGSQNVHRSNVDVIADTNKLRLVGHVRESNVQSNNDSLLISFYSNVLGFSNPALINVTGVLVGIITYDDRLVITGKLTWTELFHWIIEESKCLRKRGADVVVLIGHARISTNSRIYKHAKNYVNLVLGVHNMHMSEAITCRGRWYGELTDRIVHLPAFSIHPIVTSVELHSTGINNQQFTMKSSSTSTWGTSS